MTTIALTRDTIACDQQATHSGGWKFKIGSKIVFIDNCLAYKTPYYIGYTGAVETAIDILDYLHDPQGKPPRSGGKAEFVILTVDKQIFTFHNNPHNWININQDYYAAGSGAPFAMGALHMGATPKEAVLAAAKLDPNTGMGVKQFKL